jgi:hypothetical protein
MPHAAREPEREATRAGADVYRRAGRIRRAAQRP